MASSQILIQGWLQKKGVKGPLKRWKRRWFWYDQSDQTICYSELVDRSKLLGRIQLRGCSVLSSMGDGGWGFEICTPGRIYELQSDTEAERRQWMAFVEAISQGRQPEAVADPSIATIVSSKTPADFVGMNEAIREREETIRLQREQIRSLTWTLDGLRNSATHGDRLKMVEAHDKIMSLTEELKNLQSRANLGMNQSQETELIVQIKRLTKENDDLKQAYFKAAAIGIMYQLNIPPDRLPSMMDLFTEAIKFHPDWNDWTTWLKANLPRRAGLA